jgi:LPXTG-motif cell wall-anchored protein
MSTPESNRPARDLPKRALPDEADAPGDAAADALEAELNEEFDDGRPTGLEIAFTPRQILGGFALVAALILLLRRRKRSR